MKSRQSNKYKNRWTHDDAQLAGNKPRSDTSSSNNLEHNQDIQHVPDSSPVSETREIINKAMVAQDQNIISNDAKLKRRKVGRLIKRLMEEGVITKDMAKQLKQDSWRPDS